MRHWLRKVARFLIYAFASLFILLLLLSATIQVQERVLRHRADRLLEDFKSVELHQTTFREMGDLAARWNGFAGHAVPCSKEHCDFAITVAALNFWISNQTLFRIVLNVNRWLGGHPAGVSATFNVRNGFVWGESYRLYIDAPPSPDGEYDLIGRIETSPGLELTTLAWPSLRIHPEYSIGGPDACMGCVAVWVRVSPFIDAEDLRRLSQFNFSCLTQIRGCRTKEDLMPRAMAQAADEKKRFPGSEQPSCGLESPRILGRVAENGAIVDVMENRAAPRYPTDERRIMGVRLVERVKRALFWETGKLRMLEAGGLAVAPINDQKNVRVGDRLIILFQPESTFTPTLTAEICGVVPYTAGNLALVRKGAAEDPRLPPLIEYDERYQPRKFSDPPTPAPPPPPEPLIP